MPCRRESYLTFAAATGFPFFPAEVVDIATDYYNIPETVWASRPKGDEETWLVQFFDASRSYSWCTSSKLDMLGESDGELTILRRGSLIQLADFSNLQKRTLYTSL